MGKGTILLSILKILSKLRCKCKSSCCSCDTTMNEETEPKEENDITIMEDIEDTFREK